MVLNAATCTIRLTDIAGEYTANSSETLAITSTIDAHAEDGDPGCFLDAVSDHFDLLYLGETDAGFNAQKRFVAAGIVAGDLRFYSPSPLHAPAAFQNVTGFCVPLPNIGAIRRSQDYIASGFDG